MVERIARWYLAQGEARLNGLELDQAGLDAELRQTLREREGVPPDLVEAEFDRIMDKVFE